MVCGGVRVERLYLSETTFWSGEASLENNHPEGPEIFKAVRQQLINGMWLLPTNLRINWKAAA